MPLLDIDGTELHWPDGSMGMVRQDEPCRTDHVQLASGERTFIVPIRVERAGCKTVSLRLRISQDWIASLDGSSDDEKSKSLSSQVAKRLVARHIDDACEVQFV